MEKEGTKKQKTLKEIWPKARNKRAKTRAERPRACTAPCKNCGHYIKNTAVAGIEPSTSGLGCGVLTS